MVSEDYETNKINIDELYPGWATVVVRDSQVDDFYKSGKLSLKDFTERPLYENEFLLLKSDIHEGKTALGIYREATKEAQSLWFKEPDSWGIGHLNLEQLFALNLLLNDRIPMVTLVGSAGTENPFGPGGRAKLKTLDEKKYRRVLVSRPIVPMGKDIGYLPGTKDEKLMNWMQPIFDNLEFILDKGHLQSDTEEVDDKVQYLLDSHKLEMEALTYIRGRSIPKQFMIVDEAQNLTPHEIKTIVSRAGVGTKIILTGDPYQIDNPYLDASSNGIVSLAERFKGNEMFGHITPTSERSPLALSAGKKSALKQKELMSKPVKNPLVAITLGDPAGIGGEVALKAISIIGPKSKSKYILLGDYKHWVSLAKKLKFRLPLVWVNDAELGREMTKGVAVLDMGGVKKLGWGKISAANGAAAVRYVAEGARLALAGDVDALATAPINKEAIQGGFSSSRALDGLVDLVEDFGIGEEILPGGLAGTVGKIL